jgi:hypothetical protein
MLKKSASAALAFPEIPPAPDAAAQDGLNRRENLDGSRFIQ